MKRDKSAFSLIELLVVVVIIGLLASILLPALKRARDAARAAFCKNNLRQLGLVTQMYLDDHKRYFGYFQTLGADRLWYFGLESPYNPSGGPGARNIDLSKAKLYPYFTTTHGIEVCPSFDYSSSRWRKKYDEITDGYGMNLYLFDTAASAVSNPSRIASFADTAQINSLQAPASPSNPMIEEWYYFEDFSAFVQFRHIDRANVLLVDGHVEAMPLAAGTLDPRIPTAKMGRLNASGDMSLFQ